MSQTAGLLLLFVVLPVVVAPLVFWIVGRGTPPVPVERTTSDLLENGVAATGELLRWRVLSTFLLDRRPMVAFDVRLDTAAPTGDDELTLTQSVPRPLLQELHPGMRVHVRLSEDGTTGAVDFAAAQGPRPQP